jgi:hypothetical protein
MIRLAVKLVRCVIGEVVAGYLEATRLEVK